MDTGKAYARTIYSDYISTVCPGFAWLGFNFTLNTL